MPSPDSVSTNDTADDNAVPKPTTEPTSAPPVETPEQLTRLAKMVADGELPFPGDLPVKHRQRLLVEVQQYRRKKLVCFIARAIAEDILRGAGPIPGRSQSDVET